METHTRGEQEKVQVAPTLPLILDLFRTIPIFVGLTCCPNFTVTRPTDTNAQSRLF